MIDVLEPRLMLSHMDFAARDTSLGPVGPDLTVAWVARPRGPLISGQTARCGLVVKNLPTATGTAPPSVLAIYLSADGVVDSADQALASVSVNRVLKPGKTFRTRIELPLPPDVPDGTYHLLARADDADAVPEGVETNNVADAGPVTLAAPFADVVPMKVTRAKLSSWRGLTLGGGVTLLVRNVGNSTFVGNLSGTNHIQEGFQDNVTGQQWTSPFTQAVSIRAGATAVITIPFASATVKPEYVFTFKAYAPGDPTPDQGIWVRVKVVFYSWGGHALNRGGIVGQGVVP